MKKEDREQLKQDLKKQNNGSFNFTAKEVCKTLRMSRAKLSRLQKSASIEFYKSDGDNGSVMFTVDALVSYIEAHTIVSYGGIEWKII